jgi:hypothetical protein
MFVFWLFGLVLNSTLQALTGRRLMKPPAKRITAKRGFNTYDAYAALSELRRRSLEDRDSSETVDLRLAELKVFPRMVWMGYLRLSLQHWR